MASLADRAIAGAEFSGYFRGTLPLRFVLLVPAAAFLAAWTWKIASPFAAAIWLACVGLEPRLNNMFCGSPRELEALRLLPVDWRRVVLLKNLSTLAIGAAATALLSVVSLYFSPGRPTPAEAGEALLYLSTVVFPLLGLGNEASARYPRRNGGPFSGGIPEAIWISLSLLVVSAPWFLITGLVEADWLCIPYAAATAASWYFRSVPGAAHRISTLRIDQWPATTASSNS